MLTQIGRIEVSTAAFRTSCGGMVFWETAVVVNFPTHDGHWCVWQPDVEAWDWYLSEWAAFIGHAMIVGQIRTHYELDKAQTAFIPVRRQIGYRWQTVTLTLSQFLAQERPDLLTAEVVWVGFAAESAAARTPALGSRPPK